MSSLPMRSNTKVVLQEEDQPSANAYGLWASGWQKTKTQTMQETACDNGDGDEGS